MHYTVQFKLHIAVGTQTEAKHIAEDESLLRTSEVQYMKCFQHRQKVKLPPGAVHDNIWNDLEGNFTNM